jgi:hypothetical protein
MLELICLYSWAGLFTAMAVARPEQANHWEEWAAALLAGALWPLVVAVRLVRWVRRRRRAS